MSWKHLKVLGKEWVSWSRGARRDSDASAGVASVRSLRWRSGIKIMQEEEKQRTNYKEKNRKKKRERKI